jgi:hypothetical protein
MCIESATRFRTCRSVLRIRYKRIRLAFFFVQPHSQLSKADMWAAGATAAHSQTLTLETAMTGPMR